MKKIIFSLIMNLTIVSNVYAFNVPNPIISYPKQDIRQYILEKHWSEPNVQYEEARLYRTLGISDIELKHRYNRYNHKMKETIISNIYSRNYSKLSDTSFQFENFYHVANKQISVISGKRSVGYCLLEPVRILSFLNDPVFVNIKSLNVNSSYLSNKINVPQNIEIKTYESQHEGYTERYVIVKNGIGNHEELLAEMFFPTEIDSSFDNVVSDFINRILYRMDIDNKYTQGIISMDDLNTEYDTVSGNDDN